MEPYRGYFEKEIFDMFKLMKFKDDKEAIAYGIESIKDFLETEVYVHSTRQIVTMHELFHGSVLALRSYLGGNTRFIVPEPGSKIGGRPVNPGYKLYGRNAGKTDFWPETKKIIETFNLKQKFNR